MSGSLLPFLIGLAVMGAEGTDDGGWIELMPGKDLSVWRQPLGDWVTASEVALDPQNGQRLAWKPGTGPAVNGPQGRTVNLVSAKEFGDIEAHVEFMIPGRSNSGIYFMGRYEVQVYDSDGVARDQYPGIECGGIYPRWVDGHHENGHSPQVNTSLPPGHWQTFDVVFRAPRFGAAGKKIRNGAFVKVFHNGKVIHENVDLTGPTRAAMYDDEKPTGPLMLQGDHGPVTYRSVRIRTLAAEETGKSG